MATWLFQDASGGQKGPVGAVNIVRLLRHNIIHADTVVWSAGMAQWQPLREVPAFAETAACFTAQWHYTPSPAAAAAAAAAGSAAQPCGPCSLKQLAALFCEGGIDGMTCVWREGMGPAWRPLAELPALKDLVAAIAQGEAAREAAMEQAAREEEQAATEAAAAAAAGGGVRGAVGNAAAAAADGQQVWANVLADVQAQQRDGEGRGEGAGEGEGGEAADVKEYVSDGGTAYAWDEGRGEWEKARAGGRKGGKKGACGKGAAGRKKKGGAAGKADEAADGGKASAKQAAQAAEAALPEEEQEARRAARRKKRKESEGWQQRTNTWVYATGLPRDVAEEELRSFFAKAGIIGLDTLTGASKIRIYRVTAEAAAAAAAAVTAEAAAGAAGAASGDEAAATAATAAAASLPLKEGDAKGDASVGYLNAASVELALTLLDGAELRPGVRVALAPAEWTAKAGKARPKKRKRAAAAAAAAMAGGKAGDGSGGSGGSTAKAANQAAIIKAKQKHALSWAEGDEDEEVGAAGGGLRIVVLTNMFGPGDFATAGFEEGLQRDLVDGLGACGDFEKVTLFEKHPDGVVSVKFGTHAAAQRCVGAMEGRFFGGRKLGCAFWDGVTNYVVGETEEEEGARLRAFGDWIDGQTAPEEGGGGGAGEGGGRRGGAARQRRAAQAMSSACFRQRRRPMRPGRCRPPGMRAIRIRAMMTGAAETF
jgi:HIV Tat-specific factor 1